VIWKANDLDLPNNQKLDVLLILFSWSGRYAFPAGFERKRKIITTVDPSVQGDCGTHIP
jgi:hypothetical protein